MTTDEGYRLEWRGPPSEVHSPFTKYHNNESLADVLLFCRGCYFHAHRLVLSIRSSYFENLFKVVGKRERDVVLVLPDMPIEVMDILLEFMYLGVAMVDASDEESVRRYAKLLGIKGLHWKKHKPVARASLEEEAEAIHDDSIDVIPPSNKRQSRSPPVEELMAKKARCENEQEEDEDEDEELSIVERRIDERDLSDRAMDLGSTPMEEDDGREEIGKWSGKPKPASKRSQQPEIVIDDDQPTTKRKATQVKDGSNYFQGLPRVKSLNRSSPMSAKKESQENMPPVDVPKTKTPDSDASFIPETPEMGLEESPTTISPSQVIEEPSHHVVEEPKDRGLLNVNNQVTRSALNCGGTSARVKEKAATKSACPTPTETLEELKCQDCSFVTIDRKEMENHQIKHARCYSHMNTGRKKKPGQSSRLSSTRF